MKKIILTLSILSLSCGINAKDFLNSINIGYNHLYNYPVKANKLGYSISINVVNIYLEYVNNIVETKSSFHAGEINLGYSIKLKGWGCPYNINCLKTTTNAVYLTPVVGFTHSDPLKSVEKYGYRDCGYWSKFSIGFGLSYRYKKLLFNTQLTNNKVGLLFGYCF
jgi:hypothetical protein